MATENRYLNKDQVESTDLYRVSLRVAENRIDAAVFSQRIDGSLLLSGDETDGSLKKLEDFVYENPLLLVPFSKADIIIETANFLIIPTDIPEKLYPTLLKEAFAEETEELVPVCNTLPGKGLRVLFGVKKEIFGFLNRAFSNPEIYCHITLLLRFFGDTARHGNAAHLFVNMRKNSIDIAVIAGSEVKIANTFSYNAIGDAVYYILAVRRELGLDSETDEIMVCGESSAKRTLLPEIRKFVPTVIPIIFPADIFRLGKESLTAPFDQIILPICE